MRTRNAWLLLVMLFSLIFPSLPVSAVVPKTFKKACAMKCCRRSEPSEATTPKCHRVAAEPEVADQCNCSLGSGEPQQKLDLTLIARTVANDLSFLLAPCAALPVPPEESVEESEGPIREPSGASDPGGHVGCWLGRAPPIALG